MKYHYAYGLLFLLASGAQACGSKLEGNESASSSGTSAGQDAGNDARDGSRKEAHSKQNPDCTQPDPNETVLACGLGPNVAVLGATDKYVIAIVVNGFGTSKVIRIDRQTSAVTEIASTDLSGGALPRVRDRFALSPDQATIVFSGDFLVGDGVMSGLQLVDVNRGVNQSLFRGGSGPIGSTAGSVDAVYFQGLNNFSGLYRLPYTAGRNSQPTKLPTTISGTPIRVTNGFLYVLKAGAAPNSIVRAPESGGDGEEWASDVAPAKWLNQVADDGTVYFAKGREVWRVRAGQRTRLFECLDPEMCTDLTAIYLTGDEIVTRAGSVMFRVDANASETAPSKGTFYTGTMPGDPIFEGTKMIYGYRTEDQSRPIEGIIAERAIR